MDTTHPQALAAQKQADERAKKRALEKQVVASCVEQGMHFIEIAPTNDFLENNLSRGKHGRMTLAYIKMRKNIFAVSTAICHPNDTFDKLTGRVTAAVAMANGRCIQLRKPSGTMLTTKQWLTHKFSEYTE